MERVEIGSQTTVRLSNGITRELRIGMAHESDPDLGIISCLSPIGKALIGKKAGEIVVYFVGNKKLRARIIAISNN